MNNKSRDVTRKLRIAACYAYTQRLFDVICFMLQTFYRPQSLLPRNISKIFKFNCKYQNLRLRANPGPASGPAQCWDPEKTFKRGEDEDYGWMVVLRMVLRLVQRLAVCEDDTMMTSAIITHSSAPCPPVAVFNYWTLFAVAGARLCNSLPVSPDIHSFIHSSLFSAKISI